MQPFRVSTISYAALILIVACDPGALGSHIDGAVAEDGPAPFDASQDSGEGPDIGVVFDAAMDAALPDGARDTSTSIPDSTVPCTPFTCTALGEDCGRHDNGCGGTVDCGACAMPVDCSGIDRAPNLELCGSTATTCSGVYTAGGDCHDFCAAAGMACVLRHGGEAGCMDEGGGNQVWKP